MQSDSKWGAISVAFIVSSKSKDGHGAVWILDSWMPQQDLIHYEKSNYQLYFFFKNILRQDLLYS